MRRYERTELGREIDDKEVKEHLLNMLIAFDEFCSKNNLHYYLSGGTLLGAVRHKGFIPWDDDIDVNMPRPECEKLIELSGGKIGEYQFNAPNFEQEYHCYHWKLFDDSVLYTQEGKEKVTPLFMDIFPIEGLPKSLAKTRKHYAKVVFNKLLHDCTFSKKIFEGRSTKSKIIHAMIHPIAALKGCERIFNDIVSSMKHYSFEDSEYVGVMAARPHTVEEKVKKSEYMPQVEMVFEGHSFIAPANYDTYLRQLYGDYMKLPPKEKQTATHGHRNFLRKM